MGYLSCKIYCYNLPLLPQCRVRAIVYSKFQNGMTICIEAHVAVPGRNQNFIQLRIYCVQIGVAQKFR